ncbi:kinetoplast polyadenylation/uridylation factor 2 [Trypanosoma cruzi]|uniref:Kinetoplast polyadenylation/uridylation factor 2 n=1 Tax=Trypanosoma cruzi TaxID=5693 RepID=A0A2V2XEU5_TRYCR|nr:kinetoplast polyadenylation/uridylation factor 2 [Trypanosoma cruzi]
MRRWITEPTRRFALTIELRRCSTATKDNESLRPSRSSGKKGTGFFGIDQSKLDLALKLHEIDFDTVVKATREALAKERARKDTVFGDGMNIKDLIPEGEKESPSAATSLSPASSAGAAGPSAPATDENVRDDSSKRMERQMFRGIVGARDIHTTNPFAVVREQSKAEGARYGLMDALRDCLLAGNWVKAMHLFESAVETSCKAVQNSFSATIVTETEETERLETLRRINATTPPRSDSTGSSMHPGVLRWSGGHFYLLLKLLLSKHRVAEAERVWDVMKRIGFVEIHMDARTLNQCMKLARNTTLPDIVSPLKESNRHTEDRIKTFRTTFLLELEELAKKKELSLDGRNKELTRAARLAELVKNGRERVEDKGEVVPLNEGGLKVGDFSGLLRRCNSEESTARVLQMMDKLQMPRGGEIFGALIAALRQPHYILTPHDMTGTVVGTKEEYDAHRKQRFERACQWFEQCPEEERSADVYNEMLQIARGDEKADEKFQNVLLEFRGAPLALANAPTEGENKDTNNTDGEQGKKKKQVKLLPPHWRVSPNGRTYEILIFRCKYLQEWRLLWALYDEAMERRVKGTQRLYQTLLEVAKYHPPQGCDSNAVIMELYEEMKGRGIEVTGIKGTVSVLNAWCATRRRRRW